MELPGVPIEGHCRCPQNGNANQCNFKRYVENLPAGGEIVMFDRSWYSHSYLLFPIYISLHNPNLYSFSPFFLRHETS